MKFEFDEVIVVGLIAGMLDNCLIFGFQQPFIWKLGGEFLFLQCGCAQKVIQWSQAKVSVEWTQSK